MDIRRTIKNIFILFLVFTIGFVPCLTVFAADLGSYDWAGYNGPTNIGYGDYWKGPVNQEFIQGCKEQSFLFFTDIMGMTDESACAILGNMANEGGFDPTTTEGRKPWAQTLPLLGGLGGGLGMVGFTDPSVMKPWGDMAKENGVPWTDLDCQLNAIADVLPSVVENSKHAGYPYVDPKINSWDDFKSSTDLQSCCNIFIHGYERCQGYQSEAVHSKRGDSGREVLEEMKSKGLSGKQYEAKNNPKEVYNDNQINKDHNSNDKLNKDDGEQEERVARKEWDSEGMPEQSEFMTNPKTVTMLNPNDLTAREKLEVGNIKESIQSTEKGNRARFRRQIVAMVGLVCCIYATILLLLYIIDVNNPFFSISLVSIFTFGLYNPKYENRAIGKTHSMWQTMHQGKDTVKIFGFILGIFIIGLLLCTGSIGIFIFQKIDFINQIADGAYNWFSGA